MKKEIDKMLFLIALICYIALSFVTEWIVKTKKMSPNGLRQVNNLLQTAAITFVNQKNGTECILIGMIHLGKESYYKTVQSLVGKYENSHKILYEGIRLDGYGYSKEMSQKERTALEGVERAQFLNARILKIFDLQNQLKALNISNSWTNVDISLKDYIIRKEESKGMYLSKNKFEKYIYFLDIIDSLMIRKIVIHYVPRILFGSIMLAIILMAIKVGYNKNAPSSRDLLAIEAIKKHGTNCNTVALWGARHLETIPALLKKEGYEERSRIWLTAYGE